MPTITTCQICGRVIKAKKGVIAHHGYKRPDSGWQTASCMGARFKPYEVACDRIPDAIKAIQESLDNTTAALKTFFDTPPEVLKVKIRRGFQEEYKEVIRPENFDSVKTLEQGAHRWYSYESEYSQRHNAMERAIKFMKSDLQFMQKRLADWKDPTVMLI